MKDNSIIVSPPIRLPVPPPAQPSPLNYLPAPIFPTKRRGMAAWVLSLVALVPALLSLLATQSGPYVDPFTFLLLILLWALSLALGIAAAVCLVLSGPTRRMPWSDYQRPALLAQLAFWCLLAVSLLAFLSRTHRL